MEIDIDDNVYDVAEFVEGDARSHHERVVATSGNDISKSSQQHERDGDLHRQQQHQQQQHQQQHRPDIATSEIGSEAGTCLIENEGERTIIFTSAAVASSQHQHQHQHQHHHQLHQQQNKHNEKNFHPNNGPSNSEPQILISSSSWIDLQGNTAEVAPELESPSFGSLSLVSCKFGGSVPADVCKLEVSGISVGDRQQQQQSEWSLVHDPSITLDSLEPIKPPRLKKIARLQKQQQQQQQQLLKQHQQQQQHQNDLLRHVMHRDKFKMSGRSVQHHHHPHQHRLNAQPRPDISAPILLATTLNPNDADAHRTLSAFSAGSILNHLELINRSHRQLPPTNQVRTTSLRPRSPRVHLIWSPGHRVSSNTRCSSRPCRFFALNLG